jgi:hypothetical protein
MKSFWMILAATAAVCAQTPRFTDVTTPAGIKFTHNSGRAGKKYLPETMGSGCAFIDLNGDGWADILLVNSKDWKPKGRKTTAAIYRNNHDGTFTDVTAGSGLDVEMFGMGVAVGDYDNDGREDIYITALEGDRLFHNEGNFKFKDVTAAAGIKNANFGTSAAWLDYDRDGKLDLFVANYVQWSEKADLWCSLDGVSKSYCTPESYKGTSSRLFHNLGNGKFEDVSQKSGIADGKSKSLGVVVFDYNGDGWPDIFVANDTQPNKLYRNLKNGTFVEEGVSAGVAFGEDGVARGAMGADAGDYDRSGRPHLLVGNFSNQMLGLYHNEGNLFVDEAPRSSVGRSSLLSLAFGVFFFDYDLDGLLDLFSANGHIDEEINRVQPRVKFVEPPLLFHNVGNGRFEDVSAKLGPDLAKPAVARGAAYADFDHDGDLDLLVSSNNGPARLLRNDANTAKNHWITLRLEGKQSNRDGIGAVVRVETGGGKQWSTIHSGSSYCSQSDLAATFGLGKETVVKTIEVEWPSGAKDRVTNVAAGRRYRIVEGSGTAAPVE